MYIVYIGITIGMEFIMISKKDLREWLASDGHGLWRTFALVLVCFVLAVAMFVWWFDPVKKIDALQDETAQKGLEVAYSAGLQEHERLEAQEKAAKKVEQPIDLIPPPPPPPPPIIQPAVVDAQTPLLYHRPHRHQLRWSVRRRDRKLYAIPKREQGLFYSSSGDYSLSVAWGSAALALRGDTPTLLIIGALWCEPCIKELGRVHDLNDRIQKELSLRTVPVLVGNRVTGPEGLRVMWGDMLDRYATFSGAAIPTEKSLDMIWGDPDQVLMGMIGKLLGWKEMRESGIPLALLFDRCGNLQLIVQGQLNDEAENRIYEATKELHGAPVSCAR